MLSHFLTIQILHQPSRIKASPYFQSFLTASTLYNVVVFSRMSLIIPFAISTSFASLDNRTTFVKSSVVYQFESAYCEKRVVASSIFLAAVLATSIHIVWLNTFGLLKYLIP